MKSVSENIYLSKDPFLQFSWSTECSPSRIFFKECQRPAAAAGAQWAMMLLEGDLPGFAHPVCVGLGCRHQAGVAPCSVIPRSQSRPGHLSPGRSTVWDQGPRPQGQGGQGALRGSREQVSWAGVGASEDRWQ